MKKLLKRLLIFLTLLTTTLLTGCGTSRLAVTPDELTNYRGFSQEAVFRKLGEPTTKAGDGKGTEVWEYKYETKKSASTVIRLTSMGVFGGANAPYVDILTFTFRNKKVITEPTIQTNVMNASMPGVNLVTSMIGSGAISTADMERAKSMAPESFKADLPTESNKKIAATMKEEDQLTVSDNKKFSMCSIKDARGKISTNAKKYGLVVADKDGRMILLKPGGGKIITSFKQVKKDVLVELSATDGAIASTELSRDICSVLETCN